MKVFFVSKGLGGTLLPKLPLSAHPPSPQGVQSKMAASSSERSIVATFRKEGDLILGCTLII